MPIIVLAIVAIGGGAFAHFGFDHFRDWYRPLPDISYDGRLIYGLTH
jgi:hypothetical protein